DRVQVAGLTRCVRVAGRLVGLASPQEIERDHPSQRAQPWNESIVQLEVVGDAVHQHDRGLLAPVIPNVQAVVITPNDRFVVVHRFLPAHRAKPCGGWLLAPGQPSAWSILGMETTRTMSAPAKRHGLARLPEGERSLGPVRRKL